LLTSLGILAAPQNQDGSLVEAAKVYAIDTKQAHTDAGYAVQLHSFRELVFVSLCVVMEGQGIAIDTIDSVMRLCISSSGSANLYRLRRGALWINRVIAGLIRKGWGHQATEFFLLSKNPKDNCIHTEVLTQVQVDAQSHNMDYYGRLA
jgi:hypothetical protein